MNSWKKITDLQLHKKRFMQILIIIEIVLIVFGIAGLFGKDKVYQYGTDMMKPGLGVLSEEKGGYYVDASVGQVGNVVEFEKLALPRGIYKVVLHYDTDTDMKNMCLANDLSSDYQTFLCNGEHLYSGLHETDFNIWLLSDKEELQFYVTYEGEGSVTVKGLEIYETNAMNRIFLFLLLVGSTFLNMCVVYAQYDKKYQIPLKSKNVTFGLGLVILLASLPLMIDGTISSGDLLYHELRIEGIKDGILNGQFPVRIAPEWQQGYGYASSIFYGETVLYLAAFFRLLGFTLITSYRLFMFVVNIATVLIAYFCFKKMFKDEYAGLLCAAVYSLSIYRISKTFICGSLGETFGIMFLPLLAYGFYRVFSQDIKEETYKRAWVPLTIGFTGLIQSHLLTCEQVGAFTILLCIIMIKKVFRPKTFVVLAKTVIYSALLSLWFLVPFLDYMLTGDFVIQNVSARTIQDRGLYPAHLLYTYYENGGTVLFEEAGMADSQPMGVGVVFVGALVVWAGILFFRKTADLKKEEIGLSKVAGGFAVLAMCMSLSVFPWDRIQALSAITATLVSSIQFPNRFLTIATVCLTVIVGVVYRFAERSAGNKGRLISFISVSVLLFISSVFLMNDTIISSLTFQIYDEECIGSGYVAGGEYLPYGADPDLFIQRDPLTDENIVVEGYEKDGLHIKVNCYNNSDAAGAMELGLLYYKGYQAWDAETGEELPVYMGNNCVVGVTVPANYQGMIEVDFVSPWYWRVAELTSVAVLALFCVDYVLRRRACEK